MIMMTTTAIKKNRRFRRLKVEDWDLANRTFGGDEPQASEAHDVGIARSIRVVAFSIRFDRDEWQRRTDALVEILVTTEKIDVVCL